RGAVARSAEGRLTHGLDRLRIGMPEDERAPRAHPVEPALSALLLQGRPGGPAPEERLVEADRPHRADRRVHPPRDQALCPPEEVRALLQSQRASSLAQYETITSPPARFTVVNDSSAAAPSSIPPAAPAALTMAYSPETL